MSSDPKEQLLSLTKIKEQEEEVKRLERLVNDGKITDQNSAAVHAQLESENAKLKMQLTILQRRVEEGLREYPKHTKNLLQVLKSAFIIATEKAFPKMGIPSSQIIVVPSTHPRFGDYQCNAAMGINKLIGDKSLNPRAIAEKIVASYPQDPYNMVEKLEVAGPGFINVHLSSSFVLKEVKSYVLNGMIPKPQKSLRVLVDLSSPNVAKEMHVGHLRSTIIGDVVARLIEYQGHDVMRINHVGDWGTQFGMLIAHLKDQYPKELPSVWTVQQLQQCYKDSKQRFDSDEEFKKRAYQAVVKLQNKDKEYYDAWLMICETSRIEFEKIYDRLNIIKLVERGESFYQDYMTKLIPFLESKNLLENDEGRKVMFTKKDGLIPLTVVKSDGGFTYDTSDFAALKYRLEEDKADWIVYVVDAGQAGHFHSVFRCAEIAGVLDPAKVRVEHVGFGVVLGEDKKKFKTRSGDTVRLKELLDEGQKRAREKLIEKGRDKEMTEEEMILAEQSLAYGCIKYSDLAHNRNHEYVFSFDKMLDDKGNTAVYLLYAYTRIKSISRKAELTPDEVRSYAQNNDLDLNHEKELKLCKKLLKFPEVIDRIMEDLYVHTLCELMYDICTTFTEFYDQCYCIEISKDTGAKKVNMGRIVLCEATATVLKQCFDLLGIKPVSKM